MISSTLGATLSFDGQINLVIENRPRRKEEGVPLYNASASIIIEYQAIRNQYDFGAG
jgi:hypothetical protein